MTSSTTMKAIRFDAYGGPEVLRYEDVPIPQPAAGQALVRVKAVAVNPLDWKIRSGMMKEMMPVKLPFIPGGDIAGTVEAVGAGVTALQVGQEVYGLQSGSDANPLPGGAYAEYAAIPVATLSAKPKTLDFVQAASVPIVALTAWQGLFGTGGLTAGQTVLIHGGAGGVGMFAIQFARWKGAKVITTATADDADFVRELGAEQVIDYQNAKFEQEVSHVDVVLDTIGGDTQARSWQTLKKGGILAATPSPPSPEDAARYGVRGAFVQVKPDGAQLAQIAELLDSGTVKTFVGATFPLAEAAKAQEQSQHGHTRGKIVLTV